MEGFDVSGVGDGFGTLAGVGGGGGAGTAGTIEAALADDGLTAGVGYVVEEAGGGGGGVEEGAAEDRQAGKHNFMGWVVSVGLGAWGELVGVG